MRLDSSALHMGVAFAAMGGWAVFANRAHPWPEALTAGLVQGMLSALITLLLKRMIEGVSRRLPGLSGLILPPVLAIAGSIGALSLIHGLAGTPEIWATIAVPVSVTALYSSFYSHTIWRARHA
ncbi:MAG: hypothetical protein Q4G26_00680 [Paracoccus sp. (in: a-proteobacteria)]|nr:hypothetical protein [Paracoccus sp. (in: a-proteobacteria)]